ncbi:hypothetical protein ABR737_40810 [Streptomyces sp. Edi2]|uniref:hypothetical protein n=1 Tax=Streptomyces sp. Edi2 TaxID=3162528 RepID=UPI00330691DE
MEKLRGLLMGTRSGSRVEQALGQGSKGNVLFGAALHAADRLRAGKPATDLEQKVLGVLRAALSDAEIKQWGEVYREAVTKLGTLAVVPEVITSRSVNTGYSFADLKAGFAPVAAEHMARANAQVVDREALAAGGGFDSPAFRAGTRAAGFGVTVFNSPEAPTALTADGTEDTADTEAAAGELAAPPTFRAKLELESFYVHRAVGDQGGGKDEIYWCASSTSDKTTGPGYKSQEFGAVKKGQTRTFTGNRTVFDGQVSNGMILSMYCWEADQSTSAWYDKLQTALNLLSKNLFDTWQWNLYTGALGPGLKLGIAMDVAIFFISVVEHLRNDDDLSCEQVFVLDRFDLALLSHRGAIDWHFDGDGYHILKVKYSGDKVPFPSGKLEYVVYTGDTPSTPITLDFDSMSPPALCSYNGKLHALYVRPSDQAVMWTFQSTGGNWSTPQRIHGWKSFYAPALAVYRGKLYTTIVSSNAAASLVWASFNGTSWTTTSSANAGDGAKAPALASWRDQLWMSHVGPDGRMWENFSVGADWNKSGVYHPWRTGSPTTFATHGTTLWHACRGSGDKQDRVDLTYCEHSGGYKDAPTPTGWRVSAGPTLVAHNNRLWLFLRSMNKVLLASTHTGNTWSNPQAVNAEAKPQSETAAAVHNGKLYVMYHR